MNLTINRNQEDKTGLLGGYKGKTFKVEFKLETTPEERRMVDDYALQNHTLVWRDTPEGKTPQLKASDLLTGYRYKDDNFGNVTKMEVSIIEACKAFNTLLLGLQAYNGKEIIDLQPKTNAQEDID